MFMVDNEMSKKYVMELTEQEAKVMKRVAEKIDYHLVCDMFRDEEPLLEAKVRNNLFAVKSFYAKLKLLMEK